MSSGFVRVAAAVILGSDGRVLLAQRPPAGLWGGLWGFPECATLNQAAAYCRGTLGLEVETEQPWPTLQHGFSHFRLDITPMPARLTGGSRRAMECTPTVWYNPEHPDQRGLAAPVKNLLQRLRAKT